MSDSFWQADGLQCLSTDVAVQVYKLQTGNILRGYETCRGPDGYSDNVYGSAGGVIYSGLGF
ncbi:hypothetical protein PGTUg99_013418 [Puccinia graminis f. sp. tritici]|uniref:Uncharacterized protein n=1 Tax=Puccinia graminis f. sp. tritici TaxID=56615 RepID=A0A5B0S7B8_PUCGR|nr:hypothetical protein PGTUg99_013418 [Puccinia graminis f. sp. tritici]